MKTLCTISTARWSALISTTEIECAPAPGFHFTVDFSCDEVHYTHVEYHSEDRSEYDSPLPRDLVDPYWVKLVAGVRGLKVRSWDIKNLRVLALATESLCLHLLDGGSVEEWCHAKRVELIESEWRVPQGRTRPRPLLMEFKKKFFVIPSNRIRPNPVK